MMTTVPACTASSPVRSCRASSRLKCSSAMSQARSGFSSVCGTSGLLDFGTLGDGIVPEMYELRREADGRGELGVSPRRDEFDDFLRREPAGDAGRLGLRLARLGLRKCALAGDGGSGVLAAAAWRDRRFSDSERRLASLFVVDWRVDPLLEDPLFGGGGLRCILHLHGRDLVFFLSWKVVSEKKRINSGRGGGGGSRGSGESRLLAYYVCVLGIPSAR